MNKDWAFEKSLEITKNQKPILAQCRNCQKLFELPDLLCTICQIALDLCAHGVACEECSYVLMLEWIKPGNLQKGALTNEQLARINEVLRKQFRKEVYEEEGYLKVRKVNEV